MRKTQHPYMTYAHALLIAAVAGLNLWASLSFTPINYPDTETYELPVLEMLSGSALSIFVRPVGYPFFIGVIYKIFGAHREFVIYAQQCVGVLSYALHYLAFRYFIRKETAAGAAFIATASGTLIFYEMAVLADFLNYIVLLTSVVFFLQYYARGQRPVFLALSALGALAAYLVRPNSLILPALVAAFLLFEAAFARQGRMRWIKHLALYAAVFISALLATDLATFAATGRAARPVGVEAPTLLSRVADHIDYTGGDYLALKERYRVLRIQHQVDYGKDPFTADASAAYELMTEMDCPGPQNEVGDLRKAAASAEARYGAHALSSSYFNVYDILRLTRCDIGSIDSVFRRITAEAIAHDPAGYAESVVLSAWDYARIPSANYGGLSRMRGDGGSAIMRAFAFISGLFEGTAAASALLVVFTAGAVFYFATADRKLPEYRLAAFLTVYLAAIYLSTAVLMNVLSPRYKLPAYWVQIVLLCLFAVSVSKNVFRRA